MAAARSIVGDVSRRKPFYVEHPDGRIAHRAEPIMLVLALLVIPAIVLEAASAQWLRTIAVVLNVVIWLGFAVELVFVLAVASSRRRTLRAHWLDAAIVVVSVPVMPSALQGARALRLVRLLRFVRLAIFGARAITAARRIFQPAGFRYVAVLTGLLVVVGGAALSAVETDTAPTLGSGIWWALTTVTTVGYGDIVPKTPGGRAIGALVMLAGISFFAVLTATIAATFVKQDEHPEEMRAGLKEIRERLSRIETAVLSDRERRG